VTGWIGPPPREVCIVMLSAIGDAVHVLPVANALKRAWPECRITWVIQPVPHTMVRDHAAIDDFVVFRRRRGLQGLREFRDFRRAMKGRHFDLLLGLQVYLKAGLITALTPSRIKLGFDRKRARDAQWLFTNRRIPARGQRHVQDQYLEFLDFLGIDPDPIIWDIRFSDPERAAQREFFAKLDRPACAVVVGTSKLEKNWNADGYARVLEALERFEFVKVDTDRQVEPSDYFRVVGLPTLVVLDSAGKEIFRREGMIEAEELAQTLNDLAGDHP